MEKLHPKLRFPEFKDTWKSSLFSNIANVTMGQSPSSSSYNTDGDGLLLIQGNADISKNRLTAPRQWTNEPTKVCDIGDLILTVRAPVGYVSKSIHKACIGRGVCSINSINNNDQEFVYQFLLDFENKWSKLEQGSTFTAVSGQEIKSINLNIPSKEEQKKIAHFLSVVDKKNTQLSKKKELLEQYKKGIMQKIFNQEIRFKDDNGNNYSKWTEAKLSDFKNLIHGDGDWILSNDLSKEGKHKLIQLGNIGYGVYKEKDLKTISAEKFIELKGTPIRKGDLLINRMVDSNLYCCILDKDGDYITSVDVCWIRDNDILNNYFLMSVLLFEKNQNKLLNLSSGSGRVRISKYNLFNEFYFMLPSFEEQTKIANFISAIDNKINQVVIQLEKTNDFKKGLLQQMFV